MIFGLLLGTGEDGWGCNLNQREWGISRLYLGKMLTRG